MLTGDYWDGLLVLAVRRDAARRRARSRSSATPRAPTARAYAHYFPATRIDAVEIDGELFEIGRRLFDLRGPQLRTAHADARPFLRRSTRRYDAIFVDTYRQPYIPFYLATAGVLRARARPPDAGRRGAHQRRAPERLRPLEKVLTATLARDFPYGHARPGQRTNTVLLGTDARRFGAARWTSPRARCPPTSRPSRPSAPRGWRPRLPGGAVYTDDRAPVEWLVDTSIVHVAAGGHR